MCKRVYFCALYYLCLCDFASHLWTGNLAEMSSWSTKSHWITGQQDKGETDRLSVLVFWHPVCVWVGGWVPPVCVFTWRCLSVCTSVLNKYYVWERHSQADACQKSSQWWSYLCIILRGSCHENFMVWYYFPFFFNCRPHYESARSPGPEKMNYEWKKKCLSSCCFFVGHMFLACIQGENSVFRIILVHSNDFSPEFLVAD